MALRERTEVTWKATKIKRPVRLHNRPSKLKREVKSFIYTNMETRKYLGINLTKVLRNNFERNTRTPR